MSILSTIFTSLKEIEKQPSHETRMIKLLETFIEIFPVKNAHLFRYSQLGYLGEGIIRLKENELNYIHHERYDVRTLPTIHLAIQERKAKFYNSREIFEKTASQYIIDPEVNSFLVVPFFCGSHVIGYIYSTQMKEDRKITEELLESTTLFCKEIGAILQASINKDVIRQTILSKREQEVMQKIADGETTKEIADFLGISELTVKQYVKLAVKKLHAKNRVHAVSELFRRGILS